MRITALYAGLLGLVLVVLSVRVIQLRHRHRAAFGDAGDEILRRRIRAQANFAEYVPMAVVLLALSEYLGMSGWLVHALGLALLGGRIAHGWGISQAAEPLVLRTIGMSATFLVTVVAALYAIKAGLGF